MTRVCVCLRALSAVYNFVMKIICGISVSVGIAFQTGCGWGECTCAESWEFNLGVAVNVCNFRDEIANSLRTNWRFVFQIRNHCSGIATPTFLTRMRIVHSWRYLLLRWKSSFVFDFVELTPHFWLLNGNWCDISILFRVNFNSEIETSLRHRKIYGFKRWNWKLSRFAMEDGTGLLSNNWHNARWCRLS